MPIYLVEPLDQPSARRIVAAANDHEAAHKAGYARTAVRIKDQTRFAIKPSQIVNDDLAEVRE